MQALLWQANQGSLHFSKDSSNQQGLYRHRYDFLKGLERWFDWRQTQRLSFERGFISISPLQTQHSDKFVLSYQNQGMPVPDK